MVAATNHRHSDDASDLSLDGGAHRRAVERTAASRPARIALHPSDFSSAGVIAAAARAVRRFAVACPSVTTAEVLGLATA